MNPVTLKDLRGDDLDAADANLVAHVSWVQQRTPGMRVVDGPDLVLVDSGLPCDTFNIVCCARLEHEAALTLQSLLDARAQGYHTAILQASADGVSLYTRLGFQPFGQITEYKPPGPAEESP